MSTPATLRPHQAILAHLLLGAAGTLLAVGIFAPILTLEKFFVVRNTVSLLSGAMELLREGHWLLFLIVALFSLVMPIAKLCLLCLFWHRDGGAEGRLGAVVHWMGVYGRWSMLDVFVVAVLFVSVKLDALARVEVHYGLYAFAGAILLTMLATAQAVHIGRALENPNQGGL